jgi:hypothetical protein
MCESIVVVGAALSADVDAPTERVHSAPGSASRSIAAAVASYVPARRASAVQPVEALAAD